MSRRREAAAENRTDNREQFNSCLAYLKKLIHLYQQILYQKWYISIGCGILFCTVLFATTIVQKKVVLGTFATIVPRMVHLLLLHWVRNTIDSFLCNYKCTNKNSTYPIAYWVIRSLGMVHFLTVL